MDESNTMI